jgi:uncharacterized SAM-dependent methyltransferase
MRLLAPHAIGTKRSALVAELRDGLGRRQPELPPRYLWAAGNAALREQMRALPEPRLGEVERALLASMPRHRVRTIVHLLPELSGATREALAPLIEPEGVAQYVRLDHPLPFAIELPLPPHLPHPRLIVCLGNAVGSASAIGAVRLLRAARAAMRAGDRLVLGMDLRADAGEVERAHNDDGGALAACYLGALTAVNDELGTDFDLTRFRYRARYVPPLRRVEMLLVATKSHDVVIDGSPYSFRKGDSVLVAVSLSFTRRTLEGMLTGVGLEIVDWRSDDRQRFAVVTAAVSTRSGHESPDDR